MPGYSGTPLARKLGLKSGLSYYTVAAPPEFLSWLEPKPDDLTVVLIPSEVLLPEHPCAVHLFATQCSELISFLTLLRTRLAQNGFIWISWPKKASRVATDISEDVIRAVALPMGWVDVKVCAVSEVWSGLKLVIRKRERPSSS